MENNAQLLKGVVAGIMPVTNGEATPIVKSNMALKTRNAIILAPHPKCKKLNVVIVDEIRATLKKLGYPEDLVQTCAPEWVKLETSQELMKQCAPTKHNCEAKISFPNVI